MRKTLYLLLFPLTFCGCSDKNIEVEANASRMVEAARNLMAGGRYVEAKDSILAMRELFPTAFNARSIGIIVMDSIELLAAQDTLAMMDSTLQSEQKILEELENQKRRGHNADYYRQRTNVFHLKQRYDELEAKTRFYLRKIEIDTQEHKKAQKNVEK